MNSAEKYHIMANLLVDVFPILNRKLCRKERLPLPSNQFFALIILNIHGAMSLSDIARVMGISKQQMTPIVNRLFNDGFLIKEPCDKDKRSSLLKITAAAEAIILKHHDTLATNLEVNLHQLSMEEVDEFIVKFKRCLELVEKLP